MGEGVGVLDKNFVMVELLTADDVGLDPEQDGSIRIIERGEGVDVIIDTVERIGTIGGAEPIGRKRGTTDGGMVVIPAHIVRIAVKGISGDESIDGQSFFVDSGVGIATELYES